ncbi:helix-turn-helix transcriptional regulator [Corynebacterium pilosum]|uniref:Predicted transcriptional regulator n=1 Tax=Corynebacterium pilosum TaxID=35756 RepID=A0A376CPM1_9CORY|nr:WYL domain-containing protein [Corynebacterium pilosum]STC70441.1 predicted transcriptional regulator [Corynebacterium pilosum]
MKDSPEKITDLVRSLNLVPYLRQHPEATVMEIARDLNLSPQHVMDALNRLHVSGVGKGPGEMIDLVADWRRVTLIDDQGLDKPLRLTPTEANALLLTLETLETIPGLVDQDAVTSAAAKIRAAVKAPGVTDTIADTDPGPATVISQALADERQLELDYYSTSSNSTRTRQVSPEKLFHRDGYTYLNAWEDGEQKSFRLDRVRRASLLDEPSAAKGSRFDAEDPFGFTDKQVAELLIAPDATWLIDYWDIELGERSRTPDDGGWWTATMPFGSPEWLVRFALSQADRVKVVSPQDVAEEIARRADSARKRYDQPDSIE